jgi:hypothetical protein
VCSLLDYKANVEDVNASLQAVSRELESKVPAKAFESAMTSQAVINQSLGGEVCMGRWLWKSGKTKVGGAVPWNVESVNTDPANFIFEKDKASLICVVPGLYEISFGFFARRKPQVQLLVDGQSVLQCTNSSSYILHSGGKQQSSVNIKQHPAGTVTGLTLHDFLALPPRSRLSVIYQGEEAGEGFIQIRKL